MPGTLILYRSKTGMTEQYAQWIHQQLGGDLLPYQKRGSVRLQEYDTILYGAGFYAGRINGLNWLKKRLPQLHGKTVVVFATGASPAESPEVAQAMSHNFTPKEQGAVKTFYLQSGLCYEKLGPVDKALVSAFVKMLQKTNTAPEHAHLFQHSYNFSSKENIGELVEYCKSKQQ